MEISMSSGSVTDVTLHEQLSALADGELGGAAAAAVCAGWRGAAPARASWHAYHLIGDVLRSDDLASDPAHDAAFIAALRARLAAEPIVVAPIRDPLDRVAQSRRSVSSVGHPGGHRRWIWTATPSIAAGVLVVAGVFMLMRSVDPNAAPGATLAGADIGAVAPAGDPQRVDAVAALDSGSSASVLVGNGRLIRDARLDSYLAAHKQFAGSSALGVPSAFLRSATVESP
jgi:sigma-E factor negative regulatory protein RseA